jgi:Polysaccharide deacetylase
MRKTFLLVATLLLSASCADFTSDVTLTTSTQLSSTLGVVLTFDDTFADQYSNAAPLLDARGIKATFLVNSPRIGTAGYMTIAQVLDLQAHGHEIGGHTLTHPNLTTLTTAQQQHEVCDDRTALLADGLSATSFAYPFGADNAAVQSVVAGCGYARARDIGGAANAQGFCGATPSCSGCAYAETTPPRTQQSIRTAPTSVGTTCDAADPQLALELARTHFHAGDILVINFHHICDGCDATLAFGPSKLASVLDWIGANGYTTMTLAQAFP